MIPIFGNSLKLVFLLGSLLPAHVGKPDPVGADHAPVPPSMAIGRSDHRSGAVLLPAKHPKNNPARPHANAAHAGKANPDPIRFSMQCDKRKIAVNEEVSLTVTVQLLTVSAAQLVFVPGSSDYTLKMLLPPGFEQTGGDFTDYVAGTLSAASKPTMTYHIRGYFRFVTPGTSFRLLRSHGQANDQSQFVEKSVITLRTPSAEPSGSSLRKGGTNPAETTLYVTSENAVAGAARAAASEYRGFVDYADCDAISGWIADQNNLRKSQSIDVYINGVKAATVLADQRRLDVARTLGVDDFSDYGYVWIIPRYYKTNAPLTVSVRPTNTSTELTLSPYQTAACPGTGPPSTTTPPAEPAPTPPVTTTTGGALTVLAPTYNCTTGAITFNTSGGDGTPVRFRAVGITDWTTNPNQYVDAGSRVSADTPPFVIYTEQSGRTITYTWSRQATCGGATPPAEPAPTPPVTTPTTTPLMVLAPAYDCATGAITFKTSGGDGSPVRFRSPGITDWTTNPNQYVDAGSRVSADTPPFTLYFEQSGRTITYTWSRQATCGGTTPPAEPAPTPPAAPPAPACAAGINTVSYAWDGGNSSITLRINASAGAPQIKLSGNTNIDWTSTYKVENSGWFWANQGMNTGPYTLSVRPAGDGGAGCSFSFIVPSPGKQLYPATGDVNPGCTPPSAPTLSAPDGTQVCNNSAITLTAAGCSGTITWSGGQSGSSIGVSAAGTYSATCTLNGCTSGPSSQLTVTACTNTNNGRYNRVLYVGNSITLHGGSSYFIVNEQNPKRGMAATSPDKDYVHLMSAKHRSLNSSVDNRTFASWDLGGQLDEATGPYWEGSSTKNNIDLSRFDPVAAWKPDLVYIRLGENVADGEITNPSQYQNRLKALIDKLISQSPGAKVVLSTAVWDKPNYDAAIRAVGAERNYPVANFSDMWPNRLINGYYALNPGIYGDPAVNNHPDDDGMAHIADKLWEATPK